ncbi:retinoblastoma-like protein 1 [Liolophura sinensis]|uniref:retinoblastoma-like protein 1 n=1 Tax=Liolophura sinensis TaxID=3198878 RepID=UPI003157F615
MPYGLSDPAAHSMHLDGPGFTVTDLLKTADVKITVFFEKMRNIRDNFDLSQTVQHQLVNLEKRYCIVMAIFHKFERLFKEVFREETHIDAQE